jgi:hypothetical protein
LPKQSAARAEEAKRVRAVKLTSCMLGGSEDRLAFEMDVEVKDDEMQYGDKSATLYLLKGLVKSVSNLNPRLTV